MIIGRKTELQRLEKIYKSKEAEFVVLYGRRRIGKTFLIREFFKTKPAVFFQVTGSQKGTLKKQLAHFSESFSQVFTEGAEMKPLESWEEAFKTLTKFIEAREIKEITKKTEEKIVIFLDELPWLATARSGILEALDYYWNHHWSRHSNIILVVCGSSASWLIKNIIYNSGGLHNRCTAEMKLSPFNLAETEEFLRSREIKLKRGQILELYMALGGVPYYLSYVEKGLTATENIQKILCDINAPLLDEFTKLFKSLFKNAKAYQELIKIIASKKEGVDRVSLEENSQCSPGGGRLSDQLEQLEQTNFIISYTPWGKERGAYYKVIDEFCLFYLSWLESSKAKERLADFWAKQTQKPSYHVWAGYAFEAICRKHIGQIIAGLNLKSAESISTWRVSKNKKNVEQEDLELLAGAQIDLLIDRSDDAITLCEIKYTQAPFVIDKAYAEVLKRKIDVFKAVTKTHKEIFMALISANGVKENKYSEDLISGVVTLEALFG